MRGLKIRRDLRLYLAVMALVPLCYGVINTVIANRTGTFPVWYGWAVAYGTVAVLFCVDAFWSLVVRYGFPARWLDPQKPCYRVPHRETRGYRRLKIRRWQGYIPEMGQLVHFKKDHLHSSDPAYLYRFAKETVYAEWMHALSILGTIPVPLLCGAQMLYCTIPICVVNVLFQIPPILIQRYNRPMLLRCYARKQREEREETYDGTSQTNGTSDCGV